jgi:hypothetical protein
MGLHTSFSLQYHLSWMTVYCEQGMTHWSRGVYVTAQVSSHGTVWGNFFLL